MEKKILNMLIYWMKINQFLDKNLFVCLFISPRNILKQKKELFFEEFLKHFDFSKSMELFSQFLNFVSLINII